MKTGTDKRQFATTLILSLAWASLPAVGAKSGPQVSIQKSYGPGRSQGKNSYHLLEKRDVHFSCQADDSDRYHLYWQKNDEKNTYSNNDGWQTFNFKSKKKNYQESKIFLNDVASETHDGTYLCLVRDKIKDTIISAKSIDVQVVDQTRYTHHNRNYESHRRKQTKPSNFRRCQSADLRSRCGSHGTCFQHRASSFCACEPNYYGILCQVQKSKSLEDNPEFASGASLGWYRISAIFQGIFAVVILAVVFACLFRCWLRHSIEELAPTPEVGADLTQDPDDPQSSNSRIEGSWRHLAAADESFLSIGLSKNKTLNKPVRTHARGHKSRATKIWIDKDLASGRKKKVQIFRHRPNVNLPHTFRPRTRYESLSRRV